MGRRARLTSETQGSGFAGSLPQYWDITRVGGELEASPQTPSPLSDPNPNSTPCCSRGRGSYVHLQEPSKKGKKEKQGRVRILAAA